MPDQAGYGHKPEYERRPDYGSNLVMEGGLTMSNLNLVMGVSRRKEKEDLPDLHRSGDGRKSRRPPRAAALSCDLRQVECRPKAPAYGFLMSCDCVEEVVHEYGDDSNGGRCQGSIRFKRGAGEEEPY
ncbi:hypothetical protein CCACVL1_03643 [Corchorus capsularis]|uniref:Uncharacterized protein n=1 Tax=Corchorus capsularis TaxID=210143 RepID=A0A1R3JY38_COCAP|nr:hypothetical protein CCACVL1_03643 [Corchorus capsularis]